MVIGLKTLMRLNRFSFLITKIYIYFEAIDVVTETIPSKITKEINDLLLAPFTDKEVTESFKQMFPTKASGPDGFPAFFFQKYWNIIGRSTIIKCLEALNERKGVQIINSTHIVLI